MKHKFVLITAAFATLVSTAPAQTNSSSHPDLSGVWAYTVLLPGSALTKTGASGNSVAEIDRGLGAPRNTAVKGSLPFTARPSYKPELQAKVKDLNDHESKTDPVFYCAHPGVPRIGPPRKIVQLPAETILFYEDVSGDPYRIIPTDGRPHRKRANPSDYGDSIGKWEGNVFVVDVVNFNDDTWFGENGYFHSDEMHVIERYWKDGENLVYQATVEDPKVLTAPWTMPPKVVKPSTEPLEESPRCVESDASRLKNDDHHPQR